MSSGTKGLWLVVLFVGALLGTAVPQTASAYCILPPGDRWDPGPGPIPVYVSRDWANGTSLHYTGLGDDQPTYPTDEIRWVKAALDVINSASADAPRLYYAGTDATVLPAGGFWSSRNPGITISTYGPCSQETDGNWAVQRNNGDDKSAILMKRGSADGGTDFSCNSMLPRLWWTDPANDEGDGSRADFVGVLVHELLHSLGLDHTDQGLTCDPAFDVGFQNPGEDTHATAMWVGAVKAWRRRLRRDDIEGLRALYGEPSRRVYYVDSKEPWSPAAGDWSDPTAIGYWSLRVNTPVGLTNSTRPMDDVMLAAFTNRFDQVKYFTGYWGGWFINSEQGGDFVPAPNGQDPIRTFDRVAVARGRPWFDPSASGERRLYHWIGADEPCCEPEVQDIQGFEAAMNVRPFHRVQSGGVWQDVVFHGRTKYKNLGAGYDPRTDMWIMANIGFCVPDDEYEYCVPAVDKPENQVLLVSTIDAPTGIGGCGQALLTAGHILSVGDIACDYRSIWEPTRCAIPVSTTSENEGPFVSWIEGTIRDHDDKLCFVREDFPIAVAGGYLSLGHMSVAMNGYHSNGDMLGAYVSGFPDTSPTEDRYSVIYDMTRPFGWLTGVLHAHRTFETDYWPLHVGNMTKASGSEHVQWRAITY